MRELSIDIESYSEVDLKTGGVYKYAEKAEILLFAYSYDHEPVECIDLFKEVMLPAGIYKDLTDPNVIKVAHNAQFERTVIGACFDLYLDPAQWRCTQVLAASAGYPLSLDDASKALGTAEKKDATGKALIKYFCVPCKPTKANGGRTRNLPEHAPDKWAQFIEYCKQDVVTEQAISEALSWVKIPEKEKLLWDLDQKINEKGVKVEMKLARNAIAMDAAFRERLTEEAVQITGLNNANSPAQIKRWLEDEEMIDVTSLTKDSVKAMLKTVESDKSKRVLEIRAEMAKTSVKKYQAIVNSVCRDGRVRGLFQFCGANRTHRWAGRLVQVQNLPRITYEDYDLLDQVRNLVLDQDSETLEMCFGSIPNQLSELIRTTFIPEKGHILIVSDFSSIEARILAWLAGEQWRLDVFKGDGKIYEASASQMFKVPIESIVKGGANWPLRQKGKVAELACGYFGGVGALMKMGAIEMGLTEDELPGIIKAWRAASPKIVKLWYDVQRSAIEAVESGELVPCGDKGMSFRMSKGNLLFKLPSGRHLVYPKAYIFNYIEKVPVYTEVTVTSTDENGVTTSETVKKLERYDHKPRKRINFYAVDQTTRQWGLSDTYSGKLVENAVQAIARDCLAEAMLNLDKAGYSIVLHVHDEVVCEMPVGRGSIHEVNKIVSKIPSWAKGLPLTADGAECNYYSK